MLTWARLCVDVVTASSPSECDAAGGAPKGPVDNKGKVDVQEVALQIGIRDGVVPANIAAESKGICHETISTPAQTQPEEVFTAVE